LPFLQLRQQPVEIRSIGVCGSHFDPLPATDLTAVEILVFGWLYQMHQDFIKARRVVHACPIDRHHAGDTPLQPCGDFVRERVLHRCANNAGVQKFRLFSTRQVVDTLFHPSEFSLRQTMVCR
jgi:hypothetical protein